MRSACRSELMLLCMQMNWCSVFVVGESWFEISTTREQRPYAHACLGLYYTRACLSIFHQLLLLYFPLNVSVPIVYIPSMGQAPGRQTL